MPSFQDDNGPSSGSGSFFARYLNAASRYPSSNPQDVDLVEEVDKEQPEDEQAHLAPDTTFDDLLDVDEDDDILQDDEDIHEPRANQVQQTSGFPCNHGADGDDGAFLARLMEKAEALHRGEERKNVLTGYEDGLTISGAQEGSSSTYPQVLLPVRDCRSAEERRQAAISFLEGMFVSILDQIHTSCQALNRMDEQKKQKKTASKRKQVDSELDAGDQATQSQNAAPGGSQTSPPDGLSSKKRKRFQDDNPEVGVVMSTKNRKTGQEQVISFPEDPGLIRTDERDTAMTKMSGLTAWSDSSTSDAGRLTVIRGDLIRRSNHQKAKIHKHDLVHGPLSDRDIFYKDVALFGDQRVVDKIIDDLIASAGLRRADFNVCASSKGLIASNILRIRLKTGEDLSTSSNLAALIPPTERIGAIQAVQPLSYILIVEKDAVFNTLCSAGLLQDTSVGHGAIVTGKGYPDLATVQLVSRLSHEHPRAKIFALVDGDPHGIDILSTYTFGSRASSFSHDHAGLALGARLRWLGIKLSEMAAVEIPLDELLPLSEHDVKKASAMLRTHARMPETWKRELCEMLHLNKKAEIEVVQGHAEDGEESSGRNRLVDYVLKRIGQD